MHAAAAKRPDFQEILQEPHAIPYLISYDGVKQYKYVFFVLFIFINKFNVIL